MERKMRNVHPGEILKMELVEGRRLSISKIAELLNKPQEHISNVLNGHSPISYGFALSLENVFGFKGDFFIRLQSTYNLREVKK